jgi:hypothetical protein
MSKVVPDHGPGLDKKTLVPGPGQKFVFDWGRGGTGPGSKFFFDRDRDRDPDQFVLAEPQTTLFY